MSRIYNFSAGPATLPEDVLVEAQKELVNYQGAGMSVMEMSHRGKPYMAVQEEAEANIRKLLKVPDDYAVLFLQGGASGQFAMVPMNFRGEGGTADYTLSGSWARKAIKEAKVTGKVHLAADVSGEQPARMPAADELDWSDDAAYAHITSNETIEGTQWKTFPETKAPLVADMSSDILSRPLDVSRFGLIYAGAQKNMGPSGVTTVIMRKDLAELAPYCSWTEGVWNLGPGDTRRWNQVQNTPKDVQMLGMHLLDCYKKYVVPKSRRRVAAGRKAR